MKLDQVVRYGNSGECRRKQLLAYFGEKAAQIPCGGCDICLPRQSPESRQAEAVGVRGVDAELFEKLRKARKKMADERRVPAFVIFGDRSLKDMAARKPADHREFAGIFGVGAAKLEAFADAFLEIIKAHVRE